MIDNEVSSEDFFIMVNDLNRYNDRQLKEKPKETVPSKQAQKKYNFVKITDCEVV